MKWFQGNSLLFFLLKEVMVMEAMLWSTLFSVLPYVISKTHSPFRVIKAVYSGNPSLISRFLRPAWLLQPWTFQTLCMLYLVNFDLNVWHNAPQVFAGKASGFRSNYLNSYFLGTASKNCTKRHIEILWAPTTGMSGNHLLSLPEIRTGNLVLP